MTLDNEDAVKKALGVSSLSNMSDKEILEFGALLPDISENLQQGLIAQIPGFQKNALEAVNVMERTFEKTLESDDKSQTQLHESLGDIRQAVKGGLGRDGISEEHERFLIETLTETGHLEAEAVADRRKFLAEQANATRRADIIQASLPIVSMVVAVGFKIMISRGGPRI